MTRGWLNGYFRHGVLTYFDDSAGDRQVVARPLGPAPAVEVVDRPLGDSVRVVGVTAADRVAAVPPGVLDRLLLHLPHTPQERFAAPFRLPGDVVSHEGAEVLVNRRKVGARLARTRLGLTLSPGPEGVIPRDCFFVGSDHPRGFDSRYAEVGFACRGHILGSGRAIL